MFKWQRHTQGSKAVSDYHDLLEFLDLRAQASESIHPDSKATGRRDGAHHRRGHHESVTSFAASSDHSNANQCILCKPQKKSVRLFKVLRDAS